MSPGNPPCSETVAPIQRDSVPPSNKPNMHETKHEEGRLLEERVQKVGSNSELRPVVVHISNLLFIFVSFLPAGKGILPPNCGERSCWYYKPGVKRKAQKGYISQLRYKTSSHL